MDDCLDKEILLSAQRADKYLQKIFVWKLEGKEFTEK